jgi:hypothetical protein
VHEETEMVGTEKRHRKNAIGSTRNRNCTTVLEESRYVCTVSMHTELVQRLFLVAALALGLSKQAAALASHTVFTHTLPARCLVPRACTVRSAALTM